MGTKLSFTNTPTHYTRPGPHGKHIGEMELEAAWVFRCEIELLQPSGAGRAGGVLRHRTNKARTGVRRDAQEHEIPVLVASNEAFLLENR